MARVHFGRGVGDCLKITAPAVAVLVCVGGCVDINVIGQRIGCVGRRAWTGLIWCWIRTIGRLM